MAEPLEIRSGDARRAAEVLLDAERVVTARGPITAHWPDLDLPGAYTVQREALHQRLQRGETLIGVKLGLTSRAKQIRMGIDAPSLAWLTDAMVLPAGVPLPRQRLIHPRAEPEIVFVMRERLAGPGITAAVALGAVDRVYGGIEIIDSRYHDFKFTLADAVADNSSSGLFVLGPLGRSPRAWTSRTKRACWRSTARWSTPPPARRCRDTRPRRLPSPRTRSASGDWPSRPARSSSPAE